MSRVAMFVEQSLLLLIYGALLYIQYVDLLAAIYTEVELDFADTCGCPGAPSTDALVVDDHGHDYGDSHDRI